MGRANRVDVGGYVYHVINRANARMRLFRGDADYAAFERIIGEAQERTGMRLLSWCVMPNHWHMVVWPSKDGDLSRFFGWLSLTHTQRWHAHRHTTGSGHVYQGRFRSFPVQTEAYLLSCCRYVERNALRAGLVDSAEQWRWGSLWRWANRRVKLDDAPELSAWPIDRPRNWVQRVNMPETQEEIDALRLCVKRGRPYGEGSWVDRMVKKYNLDVTMRSPGRPRNIGLD